MREEPKSLFYNARRGGRTMYEDRHFLRRCLAERAAKGENVRRAQRNLRFPRLSFHWIYLRKFGLRRWICD